MMAEQFGLGNAFPERRFGDLPGISTLHEEDLVASTEELLDRQLLDRRSFGELDLRSVDLTSSQLRHCDFRGVDFIGTDLFDADLTGAYLEGAILNPNRMDAGTTLPDGLPYLGPVDLYRFTDPNHPNFFRPGSSLNPPATATD